MTTPQLAYVLYFEALPDIPGPTKIEGLFHDAFEMTGLEHAKARGAFQYGVPFDAWTREDGNPRVGIRSGWFAAVEHGTLIIEQHVIEPIPAPPTRRTGRRSEPKV